jgi:hypothetical protein
MAQMPALADWCDLREDALHSWAVPLVAPAAEGSTGGTPAEELLLLQLLIPEGGATQQAHDEGADGSAGGGGSASSAAASLPQYRAVASAIAALDGACGAGGAPAPFRCLDAQHPPDCALCTPPPEDCALYVLRSSGGACCGGPTQPA